MIFTNSCKQPDPPKATVTVVDENGRIVEEATVIIKSFNSNEANTVIYFEDRTKNIADTQYTNLEGKINYNFKYKAIYSIEAIKTYRTNPYRKAGTGVLMLEEDKTTETTVMIKP